MITTVVVIVFFLIGEKVLIHTSEEYRNQKRIELWKSRMSVFYKDWGKVKINKSLEIPEVRDDDWSYPWYIIKYNDDQFENTTGEMIDKEDTVRMIHNSSCYSLSDNDTLSRLKFCKAVLEGEELKLKIFDESASNFEDLLITIYNGDRFRSRYKIAYVFPYDSISIKIKNEELIINKEAYSKGDKLIGELDIEFIETIYLGIEKRTKTKRIIGNFSAILE